MKKISLCIGASMLSLVALAQTRVSLTDCYEQAIQNSPLSGQSALYQQMADHKEDRLTTNYLPKVSVNGQWSYQSDVITFPISIPGSDIPTIPKDQYQAYAELNQVIYDGGMTRQSKKMNREELAVNQSGAEADLFGVKSAINSLYFSILRTQETEKNLLASKNTLTERKKTIDAAFKAGTLLPSEKAAFEKKILSLEQQIISTQTEKQALIEMLNDKLGQSVSEASEFLLPNDTIATDEPISNKRPELQKLEHQQILLDETSDLSTSRNLPTLSAFVRGGAGSPNPYNFFETSFSPFYIAGVRLNWTLFDWGGNKSEQQQLAVQSEVLKNYQTDLEQQLNNGSIQWKRKWLASEEIIQRDEEIIRLQESIVTEYSERLEEGTVTSSDYISELDQLTQARIMARMHEIDQSWYYIQYQTLTGNL